MKSRFYPLTHIHLLIGLFIFSIGYFLFFYLQYSFSGRQPGIVVDQSGVGQVSGGTTLEASYTLISPEQ